MLYNTVLSYSKNKLDTKHFYQNIEGDSFSYFYLYKKAIIKYGNNSHFVEIGQDKGKSTAYLAVEIINSNYDIKFDSIYQSNDFIKNIEQVKSKVNLIEKNYTDASNLYEDNSLNFVFINFIDSKEDILNLIKSWLPKIKFGGTISGNNHNNIVNKFFKNNNLEVSENCWIYKKDMKEKPKITLVTGIWDLKRDTLTNEWNRSYNHYVEKFKELLKTECNLIVYGDIELEKIVWESRNRENTLFIHRNVDRFIDNEFYEKIQKIRKNPDWLSLAGWLPNSTQASLELYNPMVMSKMFLLNDARLLDQFDSDYMFWIDGGLTNTVHWGYFTNDLIDRLPKYVDKFSFVAFPYDAEREIHGFEYKKLCEIAGDKVDKVARGGFFGGPTHTIHEANAIYYHILYDTLNSGYMGTEESIFTILLYKYCEKFNYFKIEYNGLIYKFFEDLGNDTLKPMSQCKKISQNFNLNINNTALYIITYNSPKQVEKLFESMNLYDSNFITKPKLILLNNSTDRNTDSEYDIICSKYNMLQIKKGNLGICGGRQFIAEHADQNEFDYYLFFEDDMFFYPHNGEICKNGFNRKVNNLYYNSLQIIKDFGYDFLKLSYSEFFGDNGTQWAWYNVPQDVREKNFPNHKKLPDHGTDPNGPRTNFKNIRSYRGIPFVDGEVYYSNWPQIVSRIGNKKMFLDTKWNHPFEQTWMSFIYQETLNGNINPAVLLISPTEHDRFDFYPSEERREN